jgi:outer membrane murein-binding lipoprotein Lpp
VGVLLPRVRTIGVRLSAHEYTALEKFCAEKGARSISDLARTAIFNHMAASGQENMLASAVNQNAAQVQELQQRIEKLASDLAVFKGRLRAGERTRKRENPKASGSDYRIKSQSRDHL